MNVPKTKKDQYYKVSSSRNEYLGVRYFRFNPNSEHTIQVVLYAGESKKGKGNTFGVYLISRLTFFTNYLAMGYAEPCKRSEYDVSFNKVIEALK